MFSHSFNGLHAHWKVSSRSASANCVEVATADVAVGVRDSKDRQGPVLLYPTATWRDFLAAAKAGLFDSPDSH